jgi:hypothetical protein
MSLFSGVEDSLAKAGGILYNGALDQFGGLEIVANHSSG